VWFRYLLPLETGQTSSMVNFTANPTGAIADRIVINGVVQIPSQVLWSKAFIKADLSTIPTGKAAAPSDFAAGWSNEPLPGRAAEYYVEPAAS